MRYVSPSREITEDDVASFQSFLESQPAEAQLNAFKNTQKFKDIVAHMKDDGATDGEIDAMMEPVIDDPGMVRGISLRETALEALCDYLTLS